MQVYAFSECPYWPAWEHAGKMPIRNIMPNRYIDPARAHTLLNQRLDEWCYADEVGLNVMVNEHHATATSMSVSASLPLIVLARQTRQARLLVLGVPLGARHDPVLVAEEIAYADVVSGGRLELGLVKGGAVEMGPTNSNPATLEERYWEAHDLVLEALKTRDKPFNFEGKHFHYREINIWPRPMQQPHPPIWMTCFSPHTVAPVADRGYIVAATLSITNAKAIFDTYRARFREYWRSDPPVDRFAYMAQVAVGNTEEEGYARLGQVRRYTWASSLSTAEFANPPGYKSPETNAKALRSPAPGSMFTNVVGISGRRSNPVTCDPRDLVDLGVGFGGTPDQVFQQIVDFYHYVGGFGHLSAMIQGGSLSHEETCDSIRLFGKEVMPRLREFAESERRKRVA